MRLDSADIRQALAQVSAAPDDDSARLMLADVLQGEGEAFGEFVALQLALEARAPGEATLDVITAKDPRLERSVGRAWAMFQREAFERRVEQAAVDQPVLLRLNELLPSLDAWAKELIPLPAIAQFRRGLPWKAEVSGRAVLANAGVTFPIELEVLTVRVAGDEPIGELLRHPLLGGAREVLLHLRTRPRGAAPRLATARALSLRLDGWNVADALLWLEIGELLPRLHTLTVNEAVDWSPTVVEQLAIGLRRLRLGRGVAWSNGDSPHALRSLFQATQFQGIDVGGFHHLRTAAQWDAFLLEHGTWRAIGQACDPLD